MKRTARLQAIAFVLILVMLTGILPPAVFAAGNVRFDDVKPTDWFYSAVEAVCGKGLMTGTSNRTFSPDQPITRGMLVTILYRLENCPKTASISSFMDIPTGAYYEKAICWAAANKIATGYDDTHFGPDDALTREQLAAILYRYADVMGYDVSSSRPHTLYADAAAVSDYAQTAVDWSIAEGFLKGKDGWKLCPKSAATRAEMAVILTRFCSYAEHQSAARINAVIAAATYLPEENPDNGLSIRFDQHETVTTQPSVTLGGTYTSDAAVASITYTLTGEYSDFLDATGDVTYADGRWEITDLLIVPDNSTVTLIITDIDGNSASATGSVYYDLGELVDPELVEVERDEETGLIFASNILLVYFAEEASDADKAAVARSVGGTVVGQDNFMNMQQLMVDPVTLEDANRIADRLEKDFPETVELAMFDLVLSEDSMTFDDPWESYISWDYSNGDEYDGKTDWIYPEGWDDDNPGGSNWNFEAIEASSAWELYGSEFKPVGVGIIDGGFNYRHEDLQGKIIFSASNGKQKSDDFLSRETFEKYHGTHVAGTIAATANNKKGITGIAHQATILASPFSGGYSDALQSLEELVQAGARVINLSFGFSGTMKISMLAGNSFDILTNIKLKAAASSAEAACYTMSKLLATGYDFVVVQSAGNGTIENYACDAIYNGMFATVCGTFHKLYRAVSLEQVLDRIMIVGSVRLNRDGSYTQDKNSNAGGAVCICAPGHQVLSCTFGTSGLGVRGGTSMAAPHVAAVAALTWSANEYLTGAQVKQILCNNTNRVAKDNASEYSKYTKGTFPLVNARLAVKKALEMKYGTATRLRATIVEGPTVDGLEASSVTASIIDSTALDRDTDPRKCRILLEMQWSKNTSMYGTEGVESRIGESFTQAEINAAMESFRKGSLPFDRPAGITGEEFEWTRADSAYPFYRLLLHIDRNYNVLGYTIVKIEKV